MRLVRAPRSRAAALVVVAALASLVSRTAAAEVPVVRPAVNAPGVVARFVVPEMRHPAEILEFAWSRDGKLCACGGGPWPHWKAGQKVTDPEYRGRVEEYVVSVFDADAQTLVARCLGHDAHLIGLVFADDGTSLATIDGLGVVCRWETRTGKLLWKQAVPEAQLPLSEFGTQLILRFSADGKRLGIATLAEHVVVLDGASGRTVDAYTFGFSTAETFDDQLRLLRVDLDRKIGFAERDEWKPDDKLIRRRIWGEDAPPWRTDVKALSPQRAAVIVEQAGNGEVVRLDRPGHEEVTLATRDEQGETTATFSRDGKTGVVGSREYNGHVYHGFVFNTDEGRITRRFEGPRSLNIGGTLSDAGDRVAMISGRVIQLVPLPSGDEVAKLVEPHVAKHAVLSPDGKLAALTDYHSLRLWDVERQSLRWSLRMSGRPCFSYDSRHLALAASGGVSFIDAATGKSTDIELPKLPERTQAWEIFGEAFSADDRTFSFTRRTRTLGDANRFDLELITIDISSGQVRIKPLYSEPELPTPLVASGRGNGMYHSWTLSPRATRLVMWASQDETAFERWRRESLLSGLFAELGVDTRGYQGGWRAIVRDVATGREAWELADADDVHFTEISPGEERIAFSGRFGAAEDGDPNTTRIYRLRDGKRLRTIAPPAIGAAAVGFFDDTHLLVAHFDRRTKNLVKRGYWSVWDAATGKELVRLEVRDLLGIAAEQRMVFVRGWDDEIALVDLKPYLGAK